MAGTLAGWPGQVVRVRAVSRAGEPSRAQVTLGTGRPEVGASVENYVLELLMIFRESFHNIRHLLFAAKCSNFWWTHKHVYTCIYRFLRVNALAGDFSKELPPNIVKSPRNLVDSSV